MFSLKESTEIKLNSLPLIVIFLVSIGRIVLQNPNAVTQNDLERVLCEGVNLFPDNLLQEAIFSIQLSNSRSKFTVVLDRMKIWVFPEILVRHTWELVIGLVWVFRFVDQQGI
jgi:hypothetical protein